MVGWLILMMAQQTLLVEYMCAILAKVERGECYKARYLKQGPSSQYR